MAELRRVGILFGGKSVEHEISLRSAQNVYQFLDKSQFQPVLIGITKKGSWHMVENLEDDISSGPALSLNLGHSVHSLETKSGESGTGKLEVVFPVLHGTDGEDGSIQGLLQVVDIAVAGSGVLGSSVAMDKLMSKRLLTQAGIPTSNFLTYHLGQEAYPSYEKVVQQLGAPFMIKPVSLGSSVGVAKIREKSQYRHAMEETLGYDQGVILEQYIQGRELECAILGNQDAKASDPGEIIINPAYEFYTYKAKYEDPEAVEIKIPAELPEETKIRIKDLSLKSYQILGCEDFARVDLFLSDKGDIYINEINTIPGFTNSSMFPSLWQQHGISYTDLLTRILNMALERHQSRQSLNRDYQTTVN